MLLREKFVSSTILPTRFRGSELRDQEIRRLKDEIASPSLFSKSKFILVEDIQLIKGDDAKTFVTLVEELIRKVPTGVTLLCVGSELASNSVLLRTFDKESLAVVLSPLEGVNLLQWTKKELRTSGITDINEEAISAIVDLSDNDPDKVVKVIEHLALYVDGPSASLDDLYKLFAEKLSPDEFKLLELITRGENEKAAVLSASLLHSGKNAFLLLSLLARSFGTYVDVWALSLRNLSPEQLAKELGSPHWLARKHVSASQRYNFVSLKKSIESLLLADSKLKNRSAGPEYVISELVHSLSPTNA